jgi:hypothetical protein
MGQREDCGFWIADLEGQKTEVGGQKSEIRGQKTEDSEETLEVGGALRFRLEAGDRGRKSEIREQKEIRGQRSDVRRQRTAGSNVQPSLR